MVESASLQSKLNTVLEAGTLVDVAHSTLGSLTFTRFPLFIFDIFPKKVLLFEWRKNDLFKI